MFHDPASYPFLRILEEHWQEILAEYQAIADPRMHAWPEAQLYDGRWDTFGLYAFGTKRRRNCELCPLTTRVIEQIPGMVMAGFSRLAPGTHVKPHVGYGGWAKYILRSHLGLIVNDDSAMRVETETRSWQAGKVSVFCDAVEHEAWNRGTTERVLLLCDFRNPAYRRRWLHPDITPELRDFIRGQWKDLSFSEKFGFTMWQLGNFCRKLWR